MNQSIVLPTFKAHSYPMMTPLRARLATSIAAARNRIAVGRDQQPACVRIAVAADDIIPAADRVDGKRRRVMVDADADPTDVRRDIIDAVRCHLAEILVAEVMHVDPVRTANSTVIAPAIFVCTDQLFLLGINGDDRLARHDLLGDMPELPVPVGMMTALLGLAVELAGTTKGDQHLANRVGADDMVHRAQRRRQFLRTANDGAARSTRRPRHVRRSAAACRSLLRRNEHAATSLLQPVLDGRIPCADRVFVDHSRILDAPKLSRNRLSVRNADRFAHSCASPMKWFSAAPRCGIGKPGHSRTTSQRVLRRRRRTP